MGPGFGATNFRVRLTNRTPWQTHRRDGSRAWCWSVLRGVGRALRRGTPASTKSWKRRWGCL